MVASLPVHDAAYGGNSLLGQWPGTHRFDAGRAQDDPVPNRRQFKLELIEENKFANAACALRQRICHKAVNGFGAHAKASDDCDRRSSAVPTGGWIALQ
jgi:hypothetical protein